MLSEVIVCGLLVWGAAVQGCVPGSLFVAMTPLPRPEGRAQCVQQGGDIAVVDTPEKLRAAIDVMASVTALDDAWIGLMANDFDFFTWENGAAISWTNWETSKQDEHSCVRLKRGGKWKHTDCSHKYPTMCMTDGSMAHNHLTLKAQHKATLTPHVEKTWTVSLLDCVTRCSKRCPGCKFLLYYQRECRLYDDSVPINDFNTTVFGTALYVSEVSDTEAVKNLIVKAASSFP